MIDGNTLCHICGIPLRLEGNSVCSAKHGPEAWPTPPSTKKRLFSTTIFESFKKPEIIVREALLNEINMQLPRCNPKQIEFFHKIFPKGISNMKETDLRSAIDLIHRTLTKNMSEEND